MHAYFPFSFIIATADTIGRIVEKHPYFSAWNVDENEQAPATQFHPAISELYY